MRGATKKVTIEIPENVFKWLEEYAKTTNKTIEEALASMLIPYYWVWEAGRKSCTKKQQKNLRNE
jgi:NADPH-dependent ferric siderophore reductase